MGGDTRVPSRIANWILEECLGSGYSGSIWRATNPFTGQVAALKVQDVDHECPTNRYERNFYPSLQGGKGMPTLWAAGVQGDYDYLVIDLLGASLDSLYRKNEKRMDLRSTICIAMQVIQRLEFMHSKGLLHRDIQLGNCVLGLGRNKGTIYMIDFGFSKRYIDPRTRKHIPDSRAKRDFIGNYWFSSVNVHCRGRVPSRRDDMEALALMLIHIMTDGGLPWTRNGIPKTDKAHDAIMRQKSKARPEDICRSLPPIFEDFLRYCRRLKFFDQPDYGYWRKEFKTFAKDMGYADADGFVDDSFVWPPRPEPIQSYGRPTSSARDDTVREIGIHDILEEFQKMQLEDLAKQLLKERKKAGFDPARMPAAPRLAPVSLPSEGPGIPRVENGKDRAPARSSQAESSDRNRGSDSKNNYPPGVIVISDSSDEESIIPSRQLDRATKQATLRLLAKRAHTASDNSALADLVQKFLETYSLTGTRSRVVTRDAFEFLEAVVQRLENSSKENSRVSRRSTRTRSQGSTTTTTTTNTNTTSDSNTNTNTTNESRLRQRQRPPLHAQKSETVKALRQRIQSSPETLTNQELAKILSEFCQAVKSTTGKTLTKDGVAVLEGVETRLKQ